MAVDDFSEQATYETHRNLRPVHTSNNVEATFDFVAKKTATMSNEFIVKVRPFDKVECCFDKVERCFDIVAGVDGDLELE